MRQRPSSASYASLNNATLAELLNTCDFPASLNNERAKEKKRGDYQANCREIKYEVTWTRRLEATKPAIPTNAIIPAIFGMDMKPSILNRAIWRSKQRRRIELNQINKVYLAEASYV